mmetsp:Transcript_33203/g.46000  ORF Transcript_33203/g.46000 Transcript_33203/m.46000 type:complete len:242 (+) Transcript_33203:265-990(+)
MESASPASQESIPEYREVQQPNKKLPNNTPQKDSGTLWVRKGDEMDLERSPKNSGIISSRSRLISEVLIESKVNTVEDKSKVLWTRREEPLDSDPRSRSNPARDLQKLREESELPNRNPTVSESSGLFRKKPNSSLSEVKQRESSGGVYKKEKSALHVREEGNKNKSLDKGVTYGKKSNLEFNASIIESKMPSEDVSDSIQNLKMSTFEVKKDQRTSKDILELPCEDNVEEVRLRFSRPKY